MFSKPITTNVKTTAKAGTDTMKRGLGKVFTGAYTLTCQVSNQDLSTQDLSTRDLSTRDLSTRDLSTRDLSTQNLSTQYLSTRSPVD